MAERIPDEIMREARKIGHNWFGVGHHDSEVLAVEIAAALYAERKRCAEIVLNNEEAFATLSPRRFLQPRTDGNLVGTAYATAILASKGGRE